MIACGNGRSHRLADGHLAFVVILTSTNRRSPLLPRRPQRRPTANVYVAQGCGSRSIHHEAGVSPIATFEGLRWRPFSLNVSVRDGTSTVQTSPGPVDSGKPFPPLALARQGATVFFRMPTCLGRDRTLYAQSTMSGLPSRARRASLESVYGEYDGQLKNDSFQRLSQPVVQLQWVPIRLLSPYRHPPTLSLFDCDENGNAAIGFAIIFALLKRELRTAARSIRHCHSPCKDVSSGFNWRSRIGFGAGFYPPSFCLTSTMMANALCSLESETGSSHTCQPRNRANVRST